MSINKQSSSSETKVKKVLITVVSVLIALAVGVTCALCFGEQSRGLDVNGATGGEVQASRSLTNTTGDQTAQGALMEGDTITYTYSGTVRSITLPAGTFTLEVWGAQGGISPHSASNNNTGGYSKGTYTITANTTIYIAVGGQGANGSSGYLGGWNGGGHGGHKGTDTGGGGGATHIARTNNRGELRYYNSYRSEVLLVAGGGGGNGCSNYVGGQGGGTNGTAGYGATNYGTPGAPGTSTGPGTTRTSGTAAGFGYGGSTTTSTSYYGCGGGGGGWFGGSAGSNVSGGGASGGGGSGYVNTVLSDRTTKTGGKTGAGQAKITVVRVNRAPVSYNKTVNAGVRGNVSVNVAASTLAYDPEGTTVYFTNGSSSNFDTFSRTANDQIYLDAACSQKASNYLEWTWAADNRSFTVSKIKMYPRNGIDGCTQNGRLTLYVKVRDGYLDAAHRGWSVIKFYLKVTPTTVTRQTATIGTGDNRYFIGISDANATAPILDASASSIYNPNGGNRYTVIFEKSLKFNTPFTITAASLLGDVYSGDQVVMAMNSTTAITGSSRKYKIDEYDANTNRVTAYNSAKVQVANTFSQLTFRCLTPDPAFQVFSVKLYAVEKTTAYGSPANVAPDINPIDLDIVFKMDNARPKLKPADTTPPVIEIDGLKSVTFDLNRFYVDDDVASMTSSTHQIKSVVIPTNEYVQLNKYGNLVSTLSGTSSYFNVVPGGSTTSSTMFDDALTKGQLKGDYGTGFQEWYISSGASDTAFVQYSFNNISLTLTGLRATYDMYKSTRGGGSIITSYSQGTAPVTQSGTIKNAGDFYILINVQDRNDTADTGIWLPLGIRVKNAAPTDTGKERGSAGASALPTAEGVTGQSFYFTPMGITVDRVLHPFGVRKAVTDSGEVYTNRDLIPLASDSDNFYTSNMLNGVGIGGSADPGKLNELVRLNITGTDLTSVLNSVAGNAGGEYFSAETFDIYIPVAYFGNRIPATGTVVSIDYNNNGGAVDCYTIKGLKITLGNWTHNRYLYASVGVIDSAGDSTTVNIAVNVKNAKPVNLTNDKVALLGYTTNGKTVTSEFKTESGVATIEYSIPVNSTAIITPYDLLRDPNVKSGVSEKFTLNGLSGVFDSTSGVFTVGGKKTGPEDIRTEITGIATSANTKGGDYGSAEYITGLKTSLSALQTTREFGSLSASNLFNAAQEPVKTTHTDGLFFARTGDSSALDGYTFDPYVSGANMFETPTVVGKDFVNYGFGNRLLFPNGSDYETYNIDYIAITATGRTQALSPVRFELNVRDRTGAGALDDARGVTKINVVINVINSTPKVQYPDNIYTLATTPTVTEDEDGNKTVHDSESITDVTKTLGTIMPTTLVFYAAGDLTTDGISKNFLVDNERDPVSFYTAGEVSVVSVDAAGNETDTDENGVPFLNNYLRVSITSQTLTVTALNSTQNVRELYIKFYATDGRSSDGRTLDNGVCRVRIQVINSDLTVNYGADGFEQIDTQNIWTIESLSNADVNRTRYFASGDNAVEKLKTVKYGENALVTSGQIKVMAKDSDALQGIVLSPAASYGDLSNRGFVNATEKDGVIDYKAAVPIIGVHGDARINVAARLFLGNDVANTGNIHQGGTDDKDAQISDYDILYFVDNTWYSATELTKAENNFVNDNHELFFDKHGRWAVRDWAIYVKPAKASSSADYINLRVMLRDETKFGGSSAGLETSYKDGIATKVDGFEQLTYQLYINDTGIVPYTYYNQFNGYYTVADGADSSKVYISTYDGNRDSAYTAVQNPLYLAGDEITTSSSSGAQSLKTRGVGDKDFSYAGTHSGEVFDASVDYAKRFEAEDTADVKERVFKYIDTITVSGERSGGTYIPTYVPMSYFALRKDIVSPGTNGAVVYPSTQYVAYDIEGNYDRNSSAISSAITISDGDKYWTGETLKDNPYVEILPYDISKVGVITDSEIYKASVNGPYFNKNLAVPSVSAEGKALGYFTDADPTNLTANGNNLVGNDGRVMYLADQTTQLQEHLFGLSLRKKLTRASASSLTISVKVANCRSGDGSLTSVAYTAGDKDKNTATVTFKLEIGNSPVTLVQAASAREGVIYDEKTGYYTTLEMTMGDSAQTIGLLRDKAPDTTVSANSANKRIYFTDSDVVTDGDGAVDHSRSDKAQFYSDSVRRLDSWALPDAYKRVASYTTGAGGMVFDNTATVSENGGAISYAQRSMQNYFGSRDPANGYMFAPANTESAMSAIGGSFQPNGGIYGSNMNSAQGIEGYSSYFGVSVLADSTTVSISPNAKTVINSAMLKDASGRDLPEAQIRAYYNERGLEYNAADKVGYYPLKVLIYDSHGDGFIAGSYVSLEIRIVIRGTAPTLSSSLENASSGVAGDKKIDIALPVGGDYEFTLANVIDSDILLNRSDDNYTGALKTNAWYWKADYDKLKTEAAKMSGTNRLQADFRLETGSYLISPFADSNYNWTNPPDNEDLRTGRAKLADNRVAAEDQADVVMYMNYKTSASSLDKTAVPEDNTVHFHVNRRTTYNSTRINEFTFKILFSDSDGNHTTTLYINVTVTNRAPYVRSSSAGVAASQKLKMRVGDSFTVITTPYDKFMGYEGASTRPSESATQSTSYNLVMNNPRSILDRNILRQPYDENYNADRQYSKMTAEALDTEKYVLHDYKKEVSDTQHLGYVAVADDDTPWGLRIESVKYYNDEFFLVPSRYDKMPLEGVLTGTEYPIDVVIYANRVCDNTPITINLIDADGARLSFTMYVTVESSRPQAIREADMKNHPRHEGLLTVRDAENDNMEVEGVYETYMTADTPSTGNLKSVAVREGTSTRTIANVYGTLELDISKIAYDPDYNDNANMALYVDKRDYSYNIFTFNGMNMERDGQYHYYNDTFDITVAEDFGSFTIRCLTFNPVKDWDELQFYIRDFGNDIFDNAIPITLRISTLYSAVTNNRQSAADKVTANGIINASTIDDVYVKPYDDYVGTSADVKKIIEDEKDLPDEEKTRIVGVDSTYQFLNYIGVPDSIDQTFAGALNDADIVNNIYNRNYDVRLYALMDYNDDDADGGFTSLSVGAASALFDITPSQLSKHYWHIKTDEDVQKRMESYFVGGMYSNGISMVGENSSLVRFLSRYFMFDIGADGVSITFRPVTANLDFDILFYVEVHKTVSSSRHIVPDGAALDSGTIFRVSVKDSAPIVNTDKSVLSFAGKINDSHIFSIHNNNDPFDSLFTDSDVADIVSVGGFIASGNTAEDYNTALKDANCEWQASQGKKRAIEIEINNSDGESGGIPAHSLRITIQRRIDKKDEGGKYLNEVTFPVYITGKDRAGRTDTATLMITIQNSDFDLDRDKLINESQHYNDQKVGYDVSQGETDRMYVFNTAVAPDSGDLNVNIVADRWLKDPDFTSMAADTDSFRLVRVDGELSDRYMFNGPVDVYPEGETTGVQPIGTLTPMFANDDLNHFIGFTVTATSYDRGITGVAYMRIIDRSGIDTRADTGITIKVNVTVLNAAPTVNDDYKNKHYTVSGSDSVAGTPIEVDVTQFVTDLNPSDRDKICIVSMMPLTPDFSEIHCTDETDNGGNIIDLTMSSDSKKVSITPRKGFYGTQNVQIMVADGNLAEDADARTVSFTVKITIVYDFGQVTGLNSVSAIRSLPTKVTTEKLFPNINDTYDESVLASGNTSGRTVYTSADGDKTFNPGKDYVITALTPIGVSNVTVRKDADDDWSFTCERETDELSFNVTFARKSDIENGVENPQTFNKTFNATVGKNSAPQLLENFKRSTGYTFKSGQGDYGLDGNGTVVISTGMLFSDVDIALGDRMLFDAKSTSVVSPTMCNVRISDDGTLLYLTFNYRGETDLTVGIKDRTGETTKWTIRIKNVDRPQASFFNVIKISVESHLFIWIGVAAGILLLIFLLILIILLVKRRKRKREELEAILISEMELEEQMLRIANTSNAAYQSFGYLPPTMPTQVDPGMMLGSGGSAPMQNDAIGLNPGQTASDGNNGVNNNSDM